MATNDTVEIIIKARDEIGKVLSQVKESLQRVKDEARNASASTKGISSGLEKSVASASNLGSELGKIVGVSLSAAGAVALINKGFSTWKSLIMGGIQAVDDYENAIISAAAAMTNMVDTGKFKGSYEEAYAISKQYFERLWVLSAEADKKASASARQIFQVGAEMAKYKMVPLTQKDVDVVARLTDAIMAFAPAGEGGARAISQIKQEIRALVEGRVIAGAQLAMQLKTQDAQFEENFRKARELGTVYEYLDSQLKGFAVAQGDMANTLGSVLATVESLWQKMQIEAFRNAYREIVEYLQDLVGLLVKNGELTETGIKLAQALAKAWDEVKVIIRQAFEQILADPSAAIKNVASIASAVGTIASAAIKAAEAVAFLMNQISSLASSPLFTGAAGAAIGFKVGGPYGAVAGGVAGIGYSAYRMGRQIADLNEQQKQAVPKFNPEKGIEQMRGQRIFVTADEINKIETQAKNRVSENINRLVGAIRRGGAPEGGGGKAEKAPKELMFEDVNRILDQMVDKAGQAAATLRELELEYQKLLHPGEAPRLDIDKWFSQTQQKATNYTKEAERIVREFGEKIKKAEADNVIVGPEVYMAYENAKNILRKIKDEEVRIVAQAAEAKLLKEKEYQDKISAEVLSKTDSLLGQLLSMERFNSEERARIASAYLANRTALIDQEITELREKYPGRIPEDTLELYRRAQLIRANEQVGSSTKSLAFEWEAAWKRAAENVQDALANTIENLLTQTKSAGDILKNIMRGALQIISQMAAKAIMSLAQYGLESLGKLGGGGGLGGILGGIFGIVGKIFGGFGGSSSYVASSGNPAIDAAIGGLSFKGFADGGISTKPMLAWVSEKGPEAHIPLQGGSVPVRMESRQPEQIQIINVFDQTAVQSIALQAMSSDFGRRVILNTVNAEMVSRGSTMRVIRGR